jgi:outer membrane protein
MKKIFVAIALVLAASASNAQFFVGGSLNLNSGSEKENDDKTESYSYFSITPKLGYYLTDEFAVGLRVGYFSDTDKEFDPDFEDKLTGWEFAPFARYTVFSSGKFSIFGEGVLSFAGSSTDDDDYKVSNVGFYVAPVLSYKLSDNFSLESSLNFLGLGYNRTKTTVDNPLSSDDDVSVSSGFGLNADSDNLIDVSNFTIGFVYEF